MKISVEWLKDFVELPEHVTGDELTDKVTLHTAEVEEVEYQNSFFKKLHVVKIVKITPHPQADRLNLVSFVGRDASGDFEREVVCGAPNLKVGQFVPYAPLGTAFPDGLVLTPKKIRGVESKGMLCSGRELGLSDDHGGLYILDEAKAKIGDTILDYLELKESVVLDIDNKSLTHRPDLWGHYGFARELSVIYDRPLKKALGGEEEQLKNQFEASSNKEGLIAPRDRGESALLSYMAYNVEGVEVGASPKWMKDRLEAAGLKSINNVVDISNYVMLELGHPSHIFDRDLIEGVEGKYIDIYALGENQNFNTLDGVERECHVGDTVIADAKGPLVIAGVMGGERSMVRETTQNILVEVANWKASDIRRLSTRLGLRTDSSQRYEKTLDTEALETTSLRLLQLITQLHPKARVVGSLDRVGPWSPTAPRKIQSSADRLSKLLGKVVPEAEMRRILVGLGFEVTESFEVTVPSYRAQKDVECEACLLEEIGRMVGYDTITPRPPRSTTESFHFDPHKRAKEQTLDFLSSHGEFFEVMTYPLVGEKLNEQAQWKTPEGPLEVQNPVSVDARFLRTSLIPSLLGVCGENKKHQDHFKIFEWGRVFNKRANLTEDKMQNSTEVGELVEEGDHLILASFHKNQSTFMEVANEVEKLCFHLGLPLQFFSFGGKRPQTYVPENWAGLHPVQKRVLNVRGKPQGAIFTVHPMVLKNYKMKGHLTCAVLDLNFLQQTASKIAKTPYRPLEKHPASFFDCTVVADEHTEVGEILKAEKKIKGKEFQWIKAVGTFSLGEGKKSVTLRSKFWDSEKSLSSEVIQGLESKVVEALKGAGFPLKS